MEKIQKNKYKGTPLPFQQQYVRPSHKEQIRHMVTTLTDMILDVDDSVYEHIKEARHQLEVAFSKMRKDKK